MKQKILVIYTSKGLGHKVIAENIGWHLEQAGFDVKLGDLFQIQAGKFLDFGNYVHTLINVYTPWLWKWLYTNKIFTDLTLPLRIKVAAKHSANAQKFIDEYNPDMVVVTQGSFAGVVAYLKKTGAYKKPLGVGFSDYHLHRYWLYDEVDFYLANIPEQKEQMVKLGIPEEKIYVCGITLKPLVKVDQEEVRRKIGLLSTERLVVFAAGSMGLGLNPQTIKELSETVQYHGRKRGLKIVLAVICGNNEKAYKQISALKLPQVKVFSYYKPLSELYQIADVFLTKPGGLSIAEALAYRLPILMTHFLPGQEELNLEYLLAKDVVMGFVPLEQMDKVAWRVCEEVQTGSFRKKLMESEIISQLSPTDGRPVVEAITLESHKKARV